MHPNNLHATRAAWALHTARTHLAARATAERTANQRHEQLPAADIPSPIWGGTRRSGHGDPTSLRVLFVEPAPARSTWWADLRDRADQRLRWIAAQLPGGHLPVDPLARIIDWIPLMPPAIAAAFGRHLVDEHHWLADAVGQAERLTDWPGDCPACGARLLQLHDAGPREHWTITCTPDCLCAGDTCPCRMPVLAQGVPHIWLRTTLTAWKD